MSTGEPRKRQQNKRANTKQQNRASATPPEATRRKRTRRTAPEAPDVGAGFFGDPLDKGVDWLFGPSDESKARVAEIRERWERLKAWGVAEKIHNTRLQQRAVADFLVAWERSPDVTAISAASADLTAIELYAEDYDKARGGSFRAAPITSTFDIEGSSRFVRGAVVADKAARDLHEAAQPLLKEVGSQLPMVMGLGIALALFGVVIAVKSVPRVPYA